MGAPLPPQGQNHTAAQAAFLPITGRLLVVRLSAMGDIIHALPAITALRAANPDLHIGWLVEERWAELLCARDADRMGDRSAAKPLVDTVHVANFKAWRQALFSNESWREMKALRGEVRDMKYDLALDLQGAIRSALAAQASGAPGRVGSSQPREKPATMFYTRQVDPRGTHVVEQALSLASDVAGRSLPYMDPLFPRRRRRRRLDGSNARPDGCQPLRNCESRRRMGSEVLAGGIVRRGCARAQRAGLAVIINHGPGEEALAEAVRESSGGVAVPVKCSVGELIALTRRASLFIGGDTGPMHLAAALRVPVVALFGPTRPERNGPYGTKSIVLRSPESLDNSSHTDHPDEGLMTIQPQAVIEAADQLLGGYVG